MSAHNEASDSLHVISFGPDIVRQHLDIYRNETRPTSAVPATLANVLCAASDRPPDPGAWIVQWPMTISTSHDNAATAARDAIDRLLAAGELRLGARQRDRLAALTRIFGPAVLVDRGGFAAKGGVVIVVEPPTGPAAERFYRSLSSGMAVAIPFGENPAFDFLKSKLTDFGTVAPCGPEAPHALWWGGLGWPSLAGRLPGATTPPLIVSCYPRETGEAAAQHLERAAARLDLPTMIAPVDAVLGDRLLAYEKADFILGVWQAQRRPLLFVDTDATLIEPPLLPSRLDCDLALHKWNRWEMSARTLYVGATETAGAFLRNWRHLAAAFPAIWDGYALDQAWSLTSSQQPLDTVWLPRAYHAPGGEWPGRTMPHGAVIVHDLPDTNADLGPASDLAPILRGARRASRVAGRETLIALRAPAETAAGVTVIVRGIASVAARHLAASIEAVAQTFANDPGEFGRLEIALCPWDDDAAATAAAAAAGGHRLIEITPQQAVASDLFSARAQTRPAAVIALPRTGARRTS